MRSDIKNIVFDFGNVLLDLDLTATGRLLHQHLGEQYETAMNRLRQSGIFELYETGGVSTAEFIDTLRHTAAPALTPEQVTDTWNAILLGMPAHRFELLLRLRQHYNVFLLSNINELHAEWIDAHMLREHGLPDFRVYFDGVYYSHLIRLRKPNREIYEYAAADAELNPTETVFLMILWPT
jgi:glucose-1-phosphatase